ncbi:MAG: hypothetical protein IKX70_07450 [Treponema sp.]|nr:hypothetical protein [Treponema sp.]
MSKKKRKAIKITKKEDYLKLFPDDDRNENEKIRYTALKEAQEIRKFEIDLYWRRTGFFWAFITIIYTALFAVLCKYVENKAYNFLVPIITTLSGLGFFFSVAWHMVNKGSKFWQKNWEEHVSLLEKTEIGPLYDVYLNPQKTGSRLNPTKEFDFSVTKINMWASFTILICSFGACVGTILWLILGKQEKPILVLLPVAVICIFTLFLIFFSNGNSDIELSENEDDELNMIQLL